jgi:hypothetical protein
MERVLNGVGVNLDSLSRNGREVIGDLASMAEDLQLSDVETARLAM